MPEWIKSTLDMVRETFDTIWPAVAEVGGSAQGMALIISILGAVFVGAAIGFFLGRQRTGVASPQAPDDVSSSTELAETAAALAMREHLSQQGFADEALESRVQAFEASLKTARRAMNALNAEDPETTPLIEAAKRSLEDGDFDETLEHLTDAQEHFVSARKSLEEQARGRARAASRTATLAGDLELARRNFGSAAEHFAIAVDNVDGSAENEVARLLTKQGTAAFKAGDRQNAAGILETAAKLVRKSSGRNHPNMAKALNLLASVRVAIGQYGAAERLYRRAASIDEAALGSDHATVATDFHNLAQVLVKRGEMKQAEPLLRRVVKIRQKALGPNHEEVRKARRSLLDTVRALKTPRRAKRIAASGGRKTTKVTDEAD